MPLGSQLRRWGAHTSQCSARVSVPITKVAATLFRMSGHLICGAPGESQCHCQEYCRLVQELTLFYCMGFVQYCEGVTSSP